MVSRRDLGNDSAIHGMQVYLAMQGLPDQASQGAIDRYSSLITARFYTKNIHRRRIITYQPAWNYLKFTVIMRGWTPALRRVYLCLEARSYAQCSRKRK